MTDRVTRANYGATALHVGTPDYLHNDKRTNAIDSIANILHAAAVDIDDANRILCTAFDHYYAEVSDDE